MKRLGRRGRVLGQAVSGEDLLDDEMEKQLLAGAGITSDVLEDMSVEEKQGTLKAILASNPALLAKLNTHRSATERSTIDRSPSGDVTKTHPISSPGCRQADSETEADGAASPGRVTHFIVTDSSDSISSHSCDSSLSNPGSNRCGLPQSGRQLKLNSSVNTAAQASASAHGHMMPIQQVTRDRGIDKALSSPASLNKPVQQVLDSDEEKVDEEMETQPYDLDHLVESSEVSPHSVEHQLLAVETTTPETQTVDSNPETSSPDETVGSLHLCDSTMKPAESSKTPETVSTASTPLRIQPPAELEHDVPLTRIYRTHKNQDKRFWPSFYAPGSAKDPDVYTDVIKLVLDIYMRRVCRAQKQIGQVATAWGKPVSSGSHVKGCLRARSSRLKEEQAHDRESKLGRALRHRNQQNPASSTVSKHSNCDDDDDDDDDDDFDLTFSQTLKPNLASHQRLQNEKRRLQVHAGTRNVATFTGGKQLQSQMRDEQNEDMVDSGSNSHESDEWIPLKVTRGSVKKKQAGFIGSKKQIRSREVKNKKRDQVKAESDNVTLTGRDQVKAESNNVTLTSRDQVKAESNNVTLTSRDQVKAESDNVTLTSRDQVKAESDNVTLTSRDQVKAESDNVTLTSRDQVKAESDNVTLTSRDQVKAESDNVTLTSRDQVKAESDSVTLKRRVAGASRKVRQVKTTRMEEDVIPVNRQDFESMLTGTRALVQQKYVWSDGEDWMETSMIGVDNTSAGGTGTPVADRRSQGSKQSQDVNVDGVDAPARTVEDLNIGLVVEAELRKHKSEGDRTHAAGMAETGNSDERPDRSQNIEDTETHGKTDAVTLDVRSSQRSESLLDGQSNLYSSQLFQSADKPSTASHLVSTSSHQRSSRRGHNTSRVTNIGSCRQTGQPSVGSRGGGKSQKDEKLSVRLSTPPAGQSSSVILSGPTFKQKNTRSSNRNNDTSEDLHKVKAAISKVSDDVLMEEKSGDSSDGKQESKFLSSNQRLKRYPIVLIQEENTRNPDYSPAVKKSKNCAEAEPFSVMAPVNVESSSKCGAHPASSVPGCMELIQDDIVDVLDSTCPICAEYFHPSKLEAHASSCGDDAEMPTERDSDDAIRCLKCAEKIPKDNIKEHQTQCVHMGTPARRMTRSNRE